MFSLFACLLIGLFASWPLARVPFSGKSLVDALIYLPLGIPPVVVGYVHLVRTFLFQRRSWIYKSLAFPSHLQKVLPSRQPLWRLHLMVRSMRLSLETIDRQLEATRAHSWCLSPVRVSDDFSSFDDIWDTFRLRFGIRSCVRRVWPDNDLCFKCSR